MAVLPGGLNAHGFRCKVDIVDLRFASDLVHENFGQWYTRRNNLQLSGAKTREPTFAYAVYTVHGTASEVVCTSDSEGLVGSTGTDWVEASDLDVCGRCDGFSEAQGKRYAGLLGDPGPVRACLGPQSQQAEELCAADQMHPGGFAAVVGWVGMCDRQFPLPLPGPASISP